MDGECTIAPGAKTRKGYGRVWRDGRNQQAHRAAYAEAHGPIPDGAHVLHRCDNPACVNPDHLYLGDHAQNMRDRADRGWRTEPGEGAPNVKLTEAQVREIWRLRGTASRAEIGRRFGVTEGAVKGIHYRRTWRHLNLQPEETP